MADNSTSQGTEFAVAFLLSKNLKLSVKQMRQESVAWSAKPLEHFTLER